MKLVVENLSGERAGHMVFANISFSLKDGEALVITGSNGSGKSTLLRVILGLLPTASGLTCSYERLVLLTAWTCIPPLWAKLDNPTYG